MKKFHVNPETGVVGACSANKRSCPLAPTDLHFTNESDAQSAAEAILASKYPEAATHKRTGKLIIIGGLPGSGKSTLVEQEARNYPGAVIINRDDERTAVAGARYHESKPDSKVESSVAITLEKRTIKALRDGGVVIDDNTNLNAQFLGPLVQIAKDYGAEVEIRFLDVPIEEAKRRNAQRGASGGRLVPEFVIDRMAKKAYSADGHIKDALIGDGQVFFVDKETPGMQILRAYNAELEAAYPIIGKDIVTIDVDGTLSFNHEALDRNIGSIAAGEKKDWNAFYKDSESSPVNASVLALARKLRAGGLTLVGLTGRTDKHAESTITFLKQADVPLSRLIMGRAGDYRGDYIVKNTAMDSLIAEGFTIVHSVDDRPSSIRAFEERGISISRVPHHLAGPVRDSYEQSIVDDITGQGFCLKCYGELPMGQLIHDTCRSV